MRVLGTAWVPPQTRGVRHTMRTQMVTVSTAREIARSMPESEEGAHVGHPDFRVRNKIIATFWPDESKVVVCVEPESHDDLVRDYPDTFSLNGCSKKHGALSDHLENISEDHFRRLVLESWMPKAPKTSSSNHCGDADRPSA